MKRLLNTLYVTLDGAYVRREGQSVLVCVEDEIKLRVPIHTLGCIICYGHTGVSPGLVDLCGRNGVGVVFLSHSGRFMGRVHGPVSGNVLLRRKQYRLADDQAASARIARGFVIGKVANSRHVLMRAARERPDASDTLTRAADRLAAILRSLQEACTLDNVRGLEGEASMVYFGAFDNLITARDGFSFQRRTRRPPLDNMNALLSFIYTILEHDAVSALESVGLDPAVGFLHRDRPGRASLALDLMEELRPILADRLALSLVNLRKLKPADFVQTESGAVRMTDEARKELLVSYQKRKQEEVQHAFLGEKVEVGLVVHCQAMLLARHLRGDLDGYPPFFWK